MSALTEKPERTPERQAFYDRIDKLALAPLWEKFADLVTPEPVSPVRPHLWAYDSLRQPLLDSGALITAKEAERRVLVLENPGLRGESRITTDLYAGLQLVLPGEVAPAHRHSQSALRLVLEAGPGAYTAVAGERTEMRFGDFVITPPWAWHDHGNEGDRPVIWLDGLDLPMVTQHFAASFAEPHAADRQPIMRPTGDSQARFGANMVPVDAAPRGPASPIFNYPYEPARKALFALKDQGPLDPCHGIRMRHVNPLDGGWAMPTIATFLQLLPAGFATAAFRSTDATVFVALEGRGRSTIGGQEFDWGPRDIFVVPGWTWVSHQANDEDAVLFAFSDRAAQEKLGLYREDRGNS